MQTNLIENLVHMETVTVWMPPIIRVAKPKKKTKAKRDEHGRFVKDEADLDTPSM